MRRHSRSASIKHELKAHALLVLFAFVCWPQISSAQLTLPYFFGGESSSAANQTLPAGCQLVEEAEPPFRVIDASGDALERSFSQGAGSVDGYYPEGTIVKLEPEASTAQSVLGSVTNAVSSTVFPRVRVLSVPPLTTHVDGLTARAKKAESNLGRRAAVGTIGYIRLTDLTPVIGAVQSPANKVFRVRQDSPALIPPELKGKPLRLAMAGSAYVTRKCCDHAVSDHLEPGVKHKREDKRNPTCKYSPVFEVLKAVDNGSGPITFQVEKTLASNNCDALISSISPISSQNFRMAFMFSQSVRKPDSVELQRLQEAAQKHVLRTRPISDTLRRKLSARGVNVSSLGGNQTKGMCKQSGNDFMVESGYIDERIPGNHAYQAKAHLDAKRDKFENLLGRLKTSVEAPPGAIMIYADTTGGSGHLEVKVDDNTYCSDYCKDAPIDAGVLQGRRKLIGIYVKKR